MYCLDPLADVCVLIDYQIDLFFRIKREAQQKHVGAAVAERQRVRLVCVCVGGGGYFVAIPPVMKWGGGGGVLEPPIMCLVY